MKLIEVNELLNAMYTDFSEHYSDRDSLSLFNLIKEEIEEQPIIDAEPVRHGHWIIQQSGTYGRTSCYCSYCGKKSGIGGIIKNQLKPYCPNCGAKMDGKVE